MIARRRILVTGATGFIGSALCRTLLLKGFPIRALTTRQDMKPKIEDELKRWSDAMPPERCRPSFEAAYCDSLTVDQARWDELCRDIEVVCHLGAIAHTNARTSESALNYLRASNYALPLALAHAAIAQRVRRFVFVSSVHVNGTNTSGTPFSEDDPPNPVGPYAIAKRDAEVSLLALAKRSNIEMVILRPPLVHGPGVKGNFLGLMRLVEKRLPMPFANIDNVRSFVGLRNLIEALSLCISHPAAAGETFLVSDDEDLSMPDVLRELGSGMQIPVRLFHLPRSVLLGLSALVGQTENLEKLYSSLQVTSSHIRQRLGWRPCVSARDGLRETAAWFAARNSSANFPID
jgi:nucleoside-diphosphate-sugar epimerase